MVKDIKRMINPYYDWWADGKPQKRKKEKPEITIPAKKPVESNNIEPIQVQVTKKANFNADNLIKMGKNPMKIITRKNPLHKVKELPNLPAGDEIWYYHSRNWHEVLARLEVGTGNRFKGKHRSNQNRRGLNPLLYPIQKQSYDRTHLIPFGYHGNENDPRLLVGWNSEQNQKELNHFEAKQKKRPYAIYWLAAIRKTDDGAKWNYRIYRASDMTLVDSITLEYKKQFHWDG